MQPFLDVDVIDKRFHRKTVLKGVRLQVAPGEIVSLVGASGCGKSTLLRIVAGLDDHYRGSVRIDGHPHCRPTRDVGFIFQEPRLFPWLTVSENVAFELGRGGEVAHGHPRVKQLLAEVGLAGRERALPKELSGGQAQRVAIARGLFREPRLLLLDEPFSAVDAFTRIHLQRLLIEVAQRHGITVLLVTHDIDEAVYLSHRVLVLAPDGLVDQVAVPMPRPRDRSDPALVPLKRRLLDALESTHAL
jgi:sulfonate transport system ATP-binding protein